MDQPVKIFLYTDCAGFEREFPFQRELLFPFGGDDAFTVTDNPEEADYFTVPFSLELVAELTGEKQYCLNFLKALPHVNHPVHGPKHFFITNDASFPSWELPRCRFFKTAFPGELTPCVDVPPMPSKPSDTWGMATAFAGKLRSRILTALDVTAAVAHRGRNGGAPPPPDNIWLGPRRNKLTLGQGSYAKLADACARRRNEVLERSRFILCPLERHGDLSDLLAAMAAARVPVVLSDELAPPLGPEVDFQEFGFLLGTSQGDLLKLRDLAQLPAADYARMAAKAREVWETKFSPAALRRQLFAALDAKRPRPILKETPEDEPQLLRRFWEELADRFAVDTSKGVVLLGAGKILKKLLQGVPAAARTPPILGVADDNAELHGKVFSGFAVRALSDYPAATLHAVVLATDTFEKEMTARVRTVWGDAVPVVGLTDFIAGHEDFDFDGYRSVPDRDWELSDSSLDDCVFSSNYQPSGLLRAKRLEGLTVCLGYGDILRWTLPHNVKHFDRFVVVTSPEDLGTQRVARDCGAELVVSDAYKSSGAAFNKGAMLNAGVAALDFDDWCLAIDSDIILNRGTRDYVFSRVLNDRLLYFTSRHNIPHDRREWWLEEYLATGVPPCAPLLLGEPEPYGFFQLFHSQADPIRGSGRKIFSEAFNNAGGVDFHFSMLWANSPCCSLAYAPLKVYHVPHGHWGANWSGRKSRKLENVAVDTPGTSASTDGWLQLVYHSATAITHINSFPQTSGYLKYTRSDTGEFVIVPYTPEMAAGDGSGGLILGKRGTGVFTCGLSSGVPGDVVLAAGASGWGIGALANSTLSGRCWNGKLMTSISDFDLSFKATITDDEREALVQLPR